MRTIKLPPHPRTTKYDEMRTCYEQPLTTYIMSHDIFDIKFCTLLIDISQDVGCKIRV